MFVAIISSQTFDFNPIPRITPPAKATGEEEESGAVGGVRSALRIAHATQKSTCEARQGGGGEGRDVCIVHSSSFR